MISIMKGYKVFNSDWTCRGKQYSCPGVFEQEGALELCKNGIHFCKKLLNCFNYYDFDSDNHVAEVEAIGEIIINVDGRKCCTNKLKIIRELTWKEIFEKVNIGNNCSGRGNIGSYNHGDYNNGTGNMGDLNSGDGNVGSINSGSYNRGNRNSGNFNNGSFNSGYYNCGNGNSGNCNVGYYNTGDWNNTDYSAGCFNTTPDKLRMFNKPTDMTREEWRSSDAYAVLSAMPEGVEYRQNWWGKISPRLKSAVLSIPNFDAKIFKEITRIDVEESKK